MNRIKFTPNPQCDYDTFITLTEGRIYKVINFDHKELLLKNDNGIIAKYSIKGYYGEERFTDVTQVYRNNIIDDILR